MTTTTQFPNPEEAPRGLRFADPTADIVWAAIQTLDEAAKHELFGHLRTHLVIPDGRGTMQQAQVAKAVGALREAAEILAGSDGSDGSDGRDAGEVLTSYAYERLRCELGRKGDWPPESSIRRFVGGTWNDALRRAALDPVADGDALRTQLGGRLTPEECAAAVRECSEETRDPLPTYSSYIAWCRRPDVRRRPGRRPHSQAPFNRCFARWADVLVAAGLAQPGEVTGPVLVVPDASLRSRAGYRWADEQILEALRTLAARLGRSPNTADYPRERERLIAERQLAGEIERPFPSTSAVLNRYRNWDAALTAAGLDPTAGRHEADGRRKPSPRRVTDEEIAVAMREAFAALGHPFTARAYETWRRRQTTVDRRDGVIRRLPSYHAIHGRFPTWERACRFALGQARP